MRGQIVIALENEKPQGPGASQAKQLEREMTQGCNLLLIRREVRNALLENGMGCADDYDIKRPRMSRHRPSAQIVNVYWTAHQVAKSGLRTKELQTEEK